jgi:hypothetical protein
MRRKNKVFFHTGKEKAFFSPNVLKSRALRLCPVFDTAEECPAGVKGKRL